MNERGSLALLLSPTTFWTFIYYLCVLYFKQTSSLLSSSSHSVSVAFQGEAGHLFILIWRLQCPSRHSVAVCSRHIWKDSITCKWNGRVLSPLGKRCVLQLNDCNLMSTEDTLRKSPGASFSPTPYSLNMRMLVNYVFNPPCGLYVCTHCKELIITLCECIWKR